MADQEPLDVAACRADITRAHTEVGEICRRTGPGRWRMSIPAQPDRDSDLLISAGLCRGERLAVEVERLRVERDRLRAAAVEAFGKLHSMHRLGSSGQEFTDTIHREVLDILSRAMGPAATPGGGE